MYLDDLLCNILLELSTYKSLKFDPNTCVVVYRLTIDIILSSLPNRHLVI